MSDKMISAVESECRFSFARTKPSVFVRTKLIDYALESHFSIPEALRAKKR